jgi:3',5'-cyclic AMP phosphodiesterase CpdA
VRPISWLHISDVHMRVRDAWSQDVVLQALCCDIKNRYSGATAADFILLTGDLAFSGHAQEYQLVEHFLDAIVEASGVARERIFCIPGNHDIQRESQRMSFSGTRTFVQSQNELDSILSQDDLHTLLKRQENFRTFQATYFIGQHRQATEDKLGYVSMLEINGLRVALVALDTAWLSEGGIEDHGKLLAGERQVINALTDAAKLASHVTVAMGHHPLHLLQELTAGPYRAESERFVLSIIAATCMSLRPRLRVSEARYVWDSRLERSSRPAWPIIAIRTSHSAF